MKSFYMILFQIEKQKKKKNVKFQSESYLISGHLAPTPWHDPGD